MDASIKLLQESNVKVCMITGDGQATASAIASMLGIQTNEKMLLSGAEVDTMTDVELQHVADKVINFCVQIGTYIPTLHRYFKVVKFS